MNRLPTEPIPIDVAFCRLKAAGWSVGDTCHGSTWIVTGNNGENVIRATAETQAEAWQIALGQAGSVGMAGKISVTFVDESDDL